jgi:predicted PurR-regulated permease PerM
LIKGVLGGLTFWIFGIGSPVLYGVVMGILSLIPMIGSWLVMYPAAIIEILMGNFWQGIAIFLICTFIVSSVDNLLGPRLVASGAGLHPLLIFFASFGGLSMFGAIGFIVGPVIAALFLSVLDVYGIEYKPQLEIAHGTGAETERRG